ncbi:hypothetical protein [Spirosoma soli]
MNTSSLRFILDTINDFRRASKGWGKFVQSDLNWMSLICVW